MSRFTQQELKTCQLVGGVVFGVSLVTVVATAICKEVGVGVPEFMQFAIIVGGSAMIGSGVFFGIATAQLMTGAGR